MSFTDSAFAGLSVTTVSDNYTNGIFADLTGDNLTIIWSGSVVPQLTTFQAIFDITPSAVDELSSAILAGTAARRRDSVVEAAGETTHTIAMLIGLPCRPGTIEVTRPCT